jgi:hypothetical protein
VRYILLSLHANLKCATTEQLGDLRRMFEVEESDPDSETGNVMRKLHALQEKWRCLSCSSNGYCFRKKNLHTGKEEHFDINPKLLRLWAALIVKGEAVMTYPPCNVDEFRQLLNSNPKGKQKAGRTTSESNDREIHVVCNANFAPFPTLPSYDNRLSTPAPKKASSTIISLVHGIHPRDYNDTGLYRYMRFCEDRYDDPAYTGEIYTKLREQNVGVDLFKEGIQLNDLRESFGFKYGDARRLISTFKMFEDKLKLEEEVLLHYNSTNSKLISSNLWSNPVFYRHF